LRQQALLDLRRRLVINVIGGHVAHEEIYDNRSAEKYEDRQKDPLDDVFCHLRCLSLKK